MTADIVRGLLPRLAWAASRDYQDRYVVNATADAYVLPGEMLDSLSVEIERAERPENQSVLSDAQRDALRRLRAVLDEQSPIAVSDELDEMSREAFAAHVLHDPSWVSIREAAAAALASLGVPNAAALSATEAETLGRAG